MKTKENNATRILILLFVLLLALTAAYAMYIRKSAMMVRRFGPGDAEMSLEVSNPEGKVWEDMYRFPGMPCGAEYSVVVNNNDDRKLTDWSVRIDFDAPFEIDSSWNGEYLIEGNSLVFSPDQEMSLVQVDDDCYFGAVLYSRHLLNVNSYSIMGKMPLDPKTMPATYILFVLYLFWFIYVGSSILSKQKIANMQKQREHDIEILDQSIRTFTSFIDAKDSYTRNHSIRVAIYAKEIGRRIGLEEDDLQNLYYGTLLHDVGKIGIPDEILGNEGRLSPEEYEIIKTHPMKGVEMLEHFTAIPNISDCAHYHHERYDGKGYPEGFTREQIPLFGRIAAIADSFDVMSLDRKYQKAMSREKIIEELNANAGTQFDPKLVPVIIGMLNDGFTDKIREEYGPTDD